MLTTIRSKNHLKSKGKIRRILKKGLLIIAILISISTLFNFIMLRVENSKYLPPGNLFDIDGHKMHIYGEGQGFPTVVMTCGSGTSSAYTDYSVIQPKLSEVTRVCVYERPGYGWSEHTTTSRSTEQIVDDLKELLIKSNEEPPYLLVAHSMGAMEVLLYANKYPEEVSGIVLIDGTSPYKHINYSKASISIAGVELIKALNFTGIIRTAIEMNLVPIVNERLQYIPEDKRDIEKAMTYKNLLNPMVIKEGDALEKSAKLMEEKLDLEEIPLVILTADESLRTLPGWEKSQESLLKLSMDSKQIIIKDSNHINIHLEHADEVTMYIEELIEKIRMNESREAN